LTFVPKMKSGAFDRTRSPSPLMNVPVARTWNNIGGRFGYRSVALAVSRHAAPKRAKASTVMRLECDGIGWSPMKKIDRLY
jgi:hypothetical protein